MSAGVGIAHCNVDVAVAGVKPRLNMAEAAKGSAINFLSPRGKRLFMLKY